MSDDAPFDAVKWLDDASLDGLLASMELALADICTGIHQVNGGNIHKMYLTFQLVLDDQKPEFLKQMLALMLAKHAALLGGADE